VLVGRAYAYGLGAAGGPGVARAIEILKSDYTRTLKLLGCPGTLQLDGSYIDTPSAWRA
jgi:L-lactate dehydrogenase (cytochrome)